MSTKPEENKYQNWVFTWNSLESEVSVLPNADSLNRFLEEEYELFVFQKEKGEETEREHYQGAFKTKIRARQGTLLKKFTEQFGPQLTKGLTLNRMCGDWSENVAYCTKEDTRVGDKYYSSVSLRKYSGRDLKIFEENIYPWQQDLLKKIFTQGKTHIKDPDDRKIYWYTDTNGNCGKSKFVKYLCFNNPSITKLSFGTAAQLRSSVVAAGPRKIYLIDIPRTLGSDDSLSSVISVLEDVKNGFVVSSMYGRNDVLMMDPPHIVCFSNQECPIHLMSLDRWEVYTISKGDKTAITYKQKSWD